VMVERSRQKNVKMTPTKKANGGTNSCLIQKLDPMLKSCFE